MGWLSGTQASVSSSHTIQQPWTSSHCALSSGRTGGSGMAIGPSAESAERVGRRRGGRDDDDLVGGVSGGSHDQLLPHRRSSYPGPGDGWTPDIDFGGPGAVA